MRKCEGTVGVKCMFTTIRSNLKDTILPLGKCSPIVCYTVTRV